MKFGVISKQLKHALQPIIYVIDIVWSVMITQYNDYCNTTITIM